MIQDIFPHAFDNQYKPDQKPGKESPILYFQGDSLLLLQEPFRFLDPSLLTGRHPLLPFPRRTFFPSGKQPDDSRAVTALSSGPAGHLALSHLDRLPDHALDAGKPFLRKLRPSHASFRYRAGLDLSFLRTDHLSPTQSRHHCRCHPRRQTPPHPLCQPPLLLLRIDCRIHGSRRDAGGNGEAGSLRRDGHSREEYPLLQVPALGYRRRHPCRILL